MSRRRVRIPEYCGVLHLRPLPGSFRAARVARITGVDYRGQLQLVIQQAVQEARILERAGFDTLMVENFGDTPFARDAVPAETVAAMALVAQAVRSEVRLPVGINVLRNDASSALAIATVTGCSFIRVNVLSGVAATDQGWMEGRARDVLADRERLNPEIRILGDVWVKHARQFSSDSIEHSIEETAFRAGADAVILTGATTGRLASQHLLEQALDTCERHDIPLYLGSGVSSESVRSLPRQGISGIIVGSDLRKGGKAGEALDSRRVSSWIRAANRHFSGA
jgi:membrane complex biogenesis BtpA family protein